VTRRPWECPRLFPGHTILILASGPSLTEADLLQARSAQHAGSIRSIVINSTFRKAPWADLLHGGDARWWNANPDALSFPGLKICSSQRGAEPWPAGVRKICSRQVEGISVHPRYISNGANSGHQAINLAVHLGAAKIVLLGFDFSVAAGSHHHGDHPEPLGNPNEAGAAHWCRLIETTVEPLQALGIDVVNCSRDTAITCFRRGDLIQEMI
jgi:hypothetical protein